MLVDNKTPKIIRQGIPWILWWCSQTTLISLVFNLKKLRHVQRVHTNGISLIQIIMSNYSWRFGIYFKIDTRGWIKLLEKKYFLSCFSTIFMFNTQNPITTRFFFLNCLNETYYIYFFDNHFLCKIEDSLMPMKWKRGFIYLFF